MFQFRHFTIRQDRCAMKVGTDGVLLGAWARGGRRILDVGTGTGLIALMMAQRYSSAQVTAVDIDKDAVLQARENVLQAAATLPGVERRVTVEDGAVQQLALAESHRGCYDAVVSNPPFFVDALQTPDRQRAMARHAVTLTYGELMAAAWSLLADDGELSVVVPFDYRQRMEDEALFRGFFLSRTCGVRTAVHKPVRRYLLAFGKHPCRCEHEVMTIGDAAYQALTQDFYLASGNTSGNNSIIKSYPNSAAL